MINLSDLQASLLSDNIALILKVLSSANLVSALTHCTIYGQAVTDLRERIEIVHTGEFGTFLQNIFPPLKELMLSRLPPQVRVHPLSIHYLQIAHVCFTVFRYQ